MSGTYLAVDTATEACSAALWLGGTVQERFEVAERGHAGLLPGMVRALLADCGVVPAQLDGIACGIGPGSFAGVRVGVAFVKGLSLALQRPVLGVSSLAMLAQACAGQGCNGVLAALDARMQEVYFGVYGFADGLAQARQPDVVAPPAAVPAVAPGVYAAVGSGWQAYGEILATATGAQPVHIEPAALPHAARALVLSLPEFAAGRGLAAADLQPLYLRNRVALTSREQQAARAAQRAEK